MGRLKKGELPPLTYIYTVCKICKLSKDDAYFKYQKGKRAGLVCRECDLQIKRDTYSGDEALREKVKARSREWSKNNPEASSAGSKNYRLVNDKEVREKKIEYHKANADRINAKSKSWYHDNKAKPEYKDGRKTYNKVNAEAIALAQAKYFRANFGRISYLNSVWRKENRQLSIFYTRQYNMNRDKRTPSWADISKIKEIYLGCPKGFEVD